jgi:hypothetical protein
MANRVRERIGRALKRPPSLKSWPPGGQILFAAILTVGFGVFVVAFLLRPSHLVPQSDSDRWAAEAATVGLGALVFAVIGTLVAVVAYVNSTQRPALDLKLLPAGGDEDRITFGPDTAGREAVGVVSLRFQLQNRGPVAARFVAVRVRVADGPWLSRPASGWLLVAERSSPLMYLWEGGADVVVHPGWTYDIPELKATFEVQQTTRSFIIVAEVVADEMATRTTVHRIAPEPFALPPPAYYVSQLNIQTWPRPYIGIIIGGTRPGREALDDRDLESAERWLRSLGDGTGKFAAHSRDSLECDDQSASPPLWMGRVFRGPVLAHYWAPALTPIPGDGQRGSVEFESILDWWRKEIRDGLERVRAFGVERARVGLMLAGSASGGQWITDLDFGKVASPRRLGDSGRYIGLWKSEIGSNELDEFGYSATQADVGPTE